MPPTFLSFSSLRVKKKKREEKKKRRGKKVLKYKILFCFLFFWRTLLHSLSFFGFCGGWIWHWLCFYLIKNFVICLYLCVLCIFIIRIQIFFLLFFIYLFILSVVNYVYLYIFFLMFKIICVLFVLKYNRYHTKRFLLILY
jgi:hypothetical protein